MNDNSQENNIPNSTETLLFTEPEVLLIMNRSRKEEKVHGVSAECALIAQCYNMAKKKHSL